MCTCTETKAETREEFEKRARPFDWTKTVGWTGDSATEKRRYDEAMKRYETELNRRFNLI